MSTETKGANGVPAITKDTITITVTGPTASGKTDMMALIASTLLGHGIQHRIEGLDVRLEVFEKRCTVGLTEVSERLMGDSNVGRLEVVLKEVNLSRQPKPEQAADVARFISDPVPLKELPSYEIYSGPAACPHMYCPEPNVCRKRASGCINVEAERNDG